jgi:hypothetical protein
MSSNRMMALLYLGGLFAVGGAKEVASITGVEIPKEGGARLCVIIGSKDDGAVFSSCDEGASSASLVRFFLLSDDFAAITGVKIAKEGGARLCVIISSASLVGFFLVG